MKTTNIKNVSLEILEVRYDNIEDFIIIQIMGRFRARKLAFNAKEFFRECRKHWRLMDKEEIEDTWMDRVEELTKVFHSLTTKKFRFSDN